MTRSPLRSPAPLLGPLLLGAALLAATLPTPDAQAQVGRPSGAGMRPAGVEPEHGPDDEEVEQLRWQATVVAQRKPGFGARYSGPNSLSPALENSYSYTATAMWGRRVWTGGELYVNPEVAGGQPLSGLTGLGGFTNGELARTAGRSPTLYLARAFLRQTWNFGGGRQDVESDQNQLAGFVDARRLVMTAGIFPLIEVFDDNAYSHDPRTRFMNWSLVTHGSYDFAADARGYSRGVALEWFDLGWAVRAGRFAMPAQSNGLPLNPAIGRSHGDQIEFEREYRLADQTGKVRLLLWRNRAVAGRFDDAIAWGRANGSAPDLTQVRGDTVKRGWGINVEQPLGTLGGAFLRVGRNDDRSETYSYTEIGGSVSGGLLLEGANWGRAGDTIGVGLARNTLGRAHRDYLAAGGLGFFLGDGALHYAPERIVEVFYSLAVLPRAWLSLDWQRIANPGYNADRGPVNVIGVRLHTNF